MSSLQTDLMVPGGRLFADAISLCAPVISKLEPSDLELSDSSFIKNEWVRKALETAIGEEVKQVSLISTRVVGQNPDLVMERSYSRDLNETLRRRHGWRLMTNLGNRLHDQLETELGFRRIERLVDRLRPDVRRMAWRNLRATLLFMMGFAYAAMEDEVRQLAPLVTILPHCIPLGERRNGSGIWNTLIR